MYIKIISSLIKIFLDQEEFLYLVNLMKSNKLKLYNGEQNWLNKVYFQEIFDIGYEYNMLANSVMLLGNHTYIQNATIFHFVGRFKPNEHCTMKQPWLAVCNKWNHYRPKLPNIGNWSCVFEFSSLKLYLSFHCCYHNKYRVKPNIIPMSNITLSAGVKVPLHRQIIPAPRVNAFSEYFWNKFQKDYGTPLFGKNWM